MRSFLILGMLALVVVGCGSTPVPPTPLPTAVPPAGDAEDGGWALSFQHEFPAGTFGPGQHRYRYLIHCPVMSSEDTASEWYYFEISEEVIRQPDPLYLRMHGLSTDPFAPLQITNTMIHPERQIVAVVHVVGLSRPAAELASTGCEILIFWDNVGRQSLAAGEIFRP
jgi:hypothetical protein